MQRPSQFPFSTKATTKRKPPTQTSPARAPLRSTPGPEIYIHPTPYSLHPTPYTLHPTPHTLHLTPHTLHPTPYTLLPTPYYTLHPTPYTLHPETYEPIFCFVSESLIASGEELVCDEGPVCWCVGVLVCWCVGVLVWTPSRMTATVILLF